MQEARPFFLPKRINRLWELAANLWWSWHPTASDLFQAVDPSLWELTKHNPVKLLRQVEPARLVELSQDRAFLKAYDSTLALMDADLSRVDTWFYHQQPDLGGQMIAFFSAEFGLHSSLPIYAGGLGILAGDICKEASDSGLPLVGVGFMYPKGYFRQRVNVDGRQQEVYDEVDRNDIPVLHPYGPDGSPCRVTVPMAQRTVSVAIWRVKCGSANLFLLDTDLPENSPEDRPLSAQLYAGDQEWRLRQELVLGIGGVRALRFFGAYPAVWHANEGHTSFMLLERLREKLDEGPSFDDAVRSVRQSSLFTTHTPVPAGHDAFPVPLAQKYLGPYCQGTKLALDSAIKLGEHREPWGAALNMTVLGMTLSGAVNAVSAKHGEVCRRMWRDLRTAHSDKPVQIQHVTNGVHVPTWLADELRQLFDRHLGSRWYSEPDDPASWKGLDEVPDRELWDVHVRLKHKLFDFVREQARLHWLEAGAASLQAPIGGVLLNTNHLTVCFAKRFATYKRATLLLEDPGRLSRILTDRWRPVQLVFAGKAHPRDEPGKQLIQQVYAAARDPRMQGRIAFIEDYDMEVARALVQGVDVWLNTPEPPMEASGTSGMKAMINGVPQFSVLDGWWVEGFNGANGWSVAESPNAQKGSQVSGEAAPFYQVLEERIVPLFYDQDREGVPHRWVAVMREAIRSVAPKFCSRRMSKEYVTKLYMPLAKGG